MRSKISPGLIGLLLALLTMASPAHADWLKAESERFLVYSNGGEGALRRYVQNLETFDRALNVGLTNSLGEPPSRKLPIYLVGGRSDLLRVAPGLGQNTAGFYWTSDEDIFAIGLREGGDDTLLHEYVHHFMFQNSAYPYPGWFVEGFAEYYMTAEFRSDRVLIGQPNDNRSYWLRNGTWLPMASLLSSRPGRSARGSETYYPLAWLLTHWFWGDPERQKMLNAYLVDVGGGGDPVEAMQRATGMDEHALRRTLRSYMSGRIPYKGLVMDIPTIPVTVTRMSPSADDLLLTGLRLRSRQEDEEAGARLLDDVRRLAARHEGDTLAEITLSRAEMMYGDRAIAEQRLGALLTRETDNVEALQMMARIRIDQANNDETGANSDRLMGQARGFLARAFRADDANYLTFMMIDEARRGAPGYPNDNDLATLRLARTLAPQLPSTSFNLASTLAGIGQVEEAVALLRPLANDPHGGGSSEAAQKMIDRITGVTDEEALARDEALDAPDGAEASGEDGVAQEDSESGQIDRSVAGSPVRSGR